MLVFHRDETTGQMQALYTDLQQRVKLKARRRADRQRVRMRVHPRAWSEAENDEQMKRLNALGGEDDPIEGEGEGGMAPPADAVAESQPHEQEQQAQEQDDDFP